MRIPAAIWTPGLSANRVSNDWIHVSDLLPTLAAAANVSLQGRDIDFDGVNQWDTLVSGQPGPRKNILHNIDPIFNYDVYVENGWKLVSGTTLNGTFDEFLGDFIEPQARLNRTYYYELIEASLTNQVLAKYGKSLDPITVDSLQKQAHVICQNRLPNATACNPLLNSCLFDLNVDPCENNNLAEMYPEIVERLKGKIAFYGLTATEPRNQPSDPSADPRYFNNTWTYWKDETPTVLAAMSLTDRLLLTILIVTLSIIVLILILVCFVNYQRQNKKEF